MMLRCLTQPPDLHVGPWLGPVGCAHALAGAVAGWVRRAGRALATGAVICASVGGAGCAPAVLDPQLRTLSPDFGYNGAETAVQVEGADLGPSLRVLAGDEIDEDSDLELWLRGPGGALRLRGVESVDDQTLRGRVPAGAEPGVYALELRDEQGRLDLLPDAFRVTDTRADRIQVQTSGLNFEVRQSARIDLQLLDPAGAEVGLPVEVELRATRGAGGAAGISFEAGLVDQVQVDEGVVRGRLEAGGGATLRLSSEVVDRVRVQVQGLGDSAFLAGESDWMYFEAGTLSGVVVEPLFVGGGVTAGQSFPLRLTLVDRYGNPTKGESAWLTVHETCAPSGPGFEVLVRVTDTATLSSAFVTGASGTASCPGNQLRAFGSAEGAAVVGISAPFDVQAGPLQRLSVEVAKPEVSAGDEDQPTWIEALDGFGNRADDPVGALELRDNAGGLDTTAGVGGARCTSFSGGLAACDLRLLRADPAVVVSARVDGAEGSSAPFAVVPSEVNALRVIGPPAATAGEPFALNLRLEDTWGNARALREDEASTAAWSDGTEGLSCAPDSEVDPGALRCTTTLARAAARVGVSLLSPPLSATTDTFDVVNGPLAHVVIDAAALDPMTAGDRRSFSLQGADAWGNPFIVGAPLTVDLAEAAGGAGLGTATLDLSGAAEVSPRFVVAAENNALTVSFDGVELGRSAPFVVEPSGWARVELTGPSPWVERGVAVTLEVRATDVFGNITPSAEGSVLLRSTLGLGADVGGALDAGRATLPFVWGSPGVQDQLRLTAGPYTTLSGGVDVVDLSCDSPPEVSVQLDGSDELRLCRVGGSTPMVAVNATGAGVVAWHIDDGTGTSSRSLTGSSTARWSQPGAYAVQALGVRADGCATAARAMAWVGDADGGPVGPVALAAVATELSADDPSQSDTIVEISALDCLGDPAAGAALGVRAELGVLFDAGSALASADGLQVTLDRNGTAELLWDVVDAPLPTDGRVLAGVPSGAAWGELSVPVRGDTTAPEVVDLRPAGGWSAPVEVLTVRFSEPMWAASVSAARVAIEDPSGAPADLAGWAWSAGGRELSLRAVSPLDPALGAYRVWISRDLRDESGLRLDGAGIGARSDFALLVGGVVASAPALRGCSVGAARFSPDGADGVDDAADTVWIEAEVEAAPSAWRFRVFDANGAERRTQLLRGAGATLNFAWDGRGDDGRVLPAGSYLIELRALDAAWAEGAACEALVDLSQRFPVPPGWE
ncbi:MAG: Ig-like domain-containing protein [Deltaproteobacteria bacterium]|nr:Ig-like domain-containing protein [Deltaproteobacteria bacterium]